MPIKTPGVEILGKVERCGSVLDGREHRPMGKVGDVARTTIEVHHDDTRGMSRRAEYRLDNSLLESSDVQLPAATIAFNAYLRGLSARPTDITLRA